MKKLFVIIALIVSLLGQSSPAYAVAVVQQGVVRTDSMPTRVDFFVSKTRKVTCVKIKTAPGHDRVVRVYDGRRRVVNIRVPKKFYTECVTSFKPKNRRVRVEVIEDLPGPFNINSQEMVRLF